MLEASVSILSVWVSCTLLSSYNRNTTPCACMRGVIGYMCTYTHEQVTARAGNTLTYSVCACEGCCHYGACLCECKCVKRSESGRQHTCMYVRICVCMYLCMYVFEYVFVYLCLCVFTYVCMCMNISFVSALTNLKSGRSCNKNGLSVRHASMCIYIGVRTLRSQQYRSTIEGPSISSQTYTRTQAKHEHKSRQTRTRRQKWKCTRTNMHTHKQRHTRTHTHTVLLDSSALTPLAFVVHASCTTLVAAPAVSAAAVIFCCSCVCAHAYCSTFACMC